MADSIGNKAKAIISVVEKSLQLFFLSLAYRPQKKLAEILYNQVFYSIIDLCCGSSAISTRGASLRRRWCRRLGETGGAGGM